MAGARETRAGVALGARYAYAVAAWLFVACAVAQVFLAGLGVFDRPDRFELHRDFGYLITFIPVIMAAVGAVGRLPRRLVLGAVIVVGLFILQSLFVALRGTAPFIAALHPVNGFLIVLAGIVLVRWSRPLVGPPLGSGGGTRPATS